MIWSLQDAKNNFSKVVQRARTEGAQLVTLRGEKAAVVLSSDDYAKLLSNRPSIVDHLLSGPEWDHEFVETVNDRSKTPSRPASL